MQRRKQWAAGLDGMGGDSTLHAGPQHKLRCFQAKSAAVARTRCTSSSSKAAAQLMLMG